METSKTAVTLSVGLGCSPQRAWALMTEPGHVARWWGDHVAFEAGPGGKLVERWTDANGHAVVTTARVVAWSPPSVLDLEWADDDWPAATPVRFRLVGADGGTVLRLVHAGWERFGETLGGRLRDVHAIGWRCHLNALAAYASR